MNVLLIHHCQQENNVCVRMRVPACCPACRDCVRHLLKIGEHDITAGDAGVCGSCGSFLVLLGASALLLFRVMTLEEVGELSDDVRIMMQRARSIAEQRDESA